MTGVLSSTRILGGRFVQELGEDSDKGAGLRLFTFDDQKKCYHTWFFSSLPQSTESPATGHWDKASKTLNWTGQLAGGSSLAMQHHFINDGAIVCNVLVKDETGDALFQAEYKLTRITETQNPILPVIETSEAPARQTAEQKLLDHLLGAWSHETTEFKAKWVPEEKHTVGASSFARVLGGRFVQETWEDTEKKNSALQLFTYDEQRKCYRIWVFSSKFGGPEAPTSANWNEAARTLEYFDFPPSEGQRPTCQMHFVSNNETVCVYTVQDAAGETLYRARYTLNRLPNIQGR